MRFFITLIFSLLTLFLFSQRDGTKSLIVAEYAKEYEGKGNYTYLTSYNFKNGTLISKDTVFGAPTTIPEKRGSYVRYDLGKNFIYNNRYAISGTGNVIDVRTGQFVIEDSDDLVELRGDSIVFHRNNIFTGTGHLLLDLKTGNYDWMEYKHFNSFDGEISPNRNYAVGIDQSEIPYKVILFDTIGTRKVLIEDCGSGTAMDMRSSSFSKVAHRWLSDNKLIYAKSSAWRKVEIETVDIRTGSVESIVTIDSIPLAFSNAVFGKLKDGKIDFYCSLGKTVIDLNEGTYEVAKFQDVGNGFQFSTSNDSLGYAVYYNAELIDKKWCLSYSSRNTNGYLAIEYGPVGSNLGYPKGIQIWSVKTKEWTTVDLPWVCAIIGWIEN